ncbi:hypothetical protein [Daejeonella sp.]|uniref:hypothetical protein n=1 Tax=Daejeonella sp. TaxID=2805397 RepID=UPI0030BA4739
MKIMKYFLFLSLFYFLNCINILAAPVNYADTSVNKSTYKQSRQYFLDNYGKDDSTRALINYFFKRRKEAFYETVVPPVTGGLAVVLLAKVVDQINTDFANGKATGLSFIVIGVPLLKVIIVSSTALIDGQIKWLVFNRKKLLTVLTDYHSGKPLPKKIKRRRAFKYELKYPG